jgi:hypothetical protein
MSLREGLDAWEQLIAKCTRVLTETATDALWRVRFTDVTESARALAHRDIDLALFVLIEANGKAMNQYSEKHALACLVIGELAANWLNWPDEEKRALALAALSMNVSMTSVQDTMAEQRTGLSDFQRTHVKLHASASAALLRNAGVADALWLYAVEHHHTVAAPVASGDDSPGPRLADLLRRVDIYTAKLSRRGTRGAVTPATAARDACLDANGKPDTIGATLLRVLGLYPPGTYVELASGETAIVVKRGKKAHTPIVASVRGPDWGLVMPPQKRDTARAGLAVRRGVEPGHAHVTFDELRVLSCAF